MDNSAIIELAEYQIDFSDVFYENIKDYRIKYVVRNEYDRRHELIKLNYDTVIVLDNSSIRYLYAYSLVKKYIEDKKSVICFYHFTLADMSELKRIAEHLCTNICFHNHDSAQNKLKAINIPVFFITGMGMHCSQLDMHIKLCKVLESRKMKVLSYTNSIYGDLLGYYSIKKIDNMRVDEAISLINKSVTEKISEIEPDVLVISDVGGIQPYNAVINNDFGIYNNLWKYACPYDYVFYNMYATEYDCVELNEIVTKVLCSINKNTLCLGLGHTAPTMAIAGLSDNDEFIEVIQDEYNILINDLKCISKYEVLDPRSEIDLDTFINKIINT